VPAQPSLSPRKLPRQGRSKATVQAILDAAARVLVKEGYEGASTNRVADTAGVSVGSVYQYFPNKEALVGAVIDRHLDQMSELLQSKVLALADAPIPVAARELVTVLLEAHQVEPKLHQVLLEEVPRVGKLDRLHRVGDEVALMLRQYLEERREHVRPRNLDLAIFLLVTSVEAIAHAIITRRAHRATPEMIEEITALIVRYLLP